ncbi:MAG: hypothetical protein H6522_03325 [Mycolicibacterium sp.]|nr:hypothetical protein [Mycolicibacterium sp.]
MRIRAAGHRRLDIALQAVERSWASATSLACALSTAVMTCKSTCVVVEF